MKLEIDLHDLNEKQLQELYRFIVRSNRESEPLERPFFCGEAADVLDALEALVGAEEAKNLYEAELMKV